MPGLWGCGLLRGACECSLAVDPNRSRNRGRSTPRIPVTGERRRCRGATARRSRWSSRRDGARPTDDPGGAAADGRHAMALTARCNDGSRFVARPCGLGRYGHVEPRSHLPTRAVPLCGDPGPSSAEAVLPSLGAHLFPPGGGERELPAGRRRKGGSRRAAVIRSFLPGSGDRELPAGRQREGPRRAAARRRHGRAQPAARPGKRTGGPVARTALSVTVEVPRCSTRLCRPSASRAERQFQVPALHGASRTGAGHCERIAVRVQTRWFSPRGW
jgi:hypothetical protein